mmetsp:Transcript_123545/g.193882  ORF Transcript_123545/g.193882 Transcript_123545/m.193882 type:complete len:579 (-) Transcript_123545:114-1850(-)
MAETPSGEETVELDDVVGEHCWHFKYNRRLSCFQHCVSSLAFSQDGKYLVSGTGSGDVKIWDTGIWAEAARLKGCRQEEPRALAISPAQRWLVVAQATVLQIFHCSPPWRLEARIPPPYDPITKEPTEWCCVAFSPMSEVDHPGGHAGQDNHLAAFAFNSLCVMDYSGGWTVDTPKRTRSIFHGSRPTSIAYTACGWWLVCGYASGQVQIWNHFSLTLERTLSAHEGTVNCIASSPRCAQYDPRFITCGEDLSLRVWHSIGWTLEQIVPDTRADRNGVKCCTFSFGGHWVVSVSAELCVWRVCVNPTGKMELRVHQRLEAVCGAEGLKVAAFCSLQDAIAVGSRDGVLGLWTKNAGMPPEHTSKKRGSERSLIRSKTDPGGGITAWIMDRPLAKPMKSVRPDGGGASTGTPDDGERRTLQGSEWFVRSDLRELTRTMAAVYGSASLAYNHSSRAVGRSRPKAVTPNIRAQLNAARDRKKLDEAEGDQNESNAKLSPEIKRWKPQRSIEFEDSLSLFCRESGDKKLLTRTTPGMFSSNSTGNVEMDAECSEEVSLLRRTMMHATRGVVQRISLDPQTIC